MALLVNIYYFSVDAVLMKVYFPALLGFNTRKKPLEWLFDCTTSKQPLLPQFIGKINNIFVS
jgi:hypothetical protein